MIVLVFLDVETTGLLPWRNGVIQIGLAWDDGFGIRVAEHLCDPGAHRFTDDSPRAMEVSGITVDQVSKAPRDYVVAKKVHRLLTGIEVESCRDGVLGGPPFLMAWNRTFDFGFTKTNSWNLDMFPWGPCVKMAWQEREGYKLHLETAARLLASRSPELKDTIMELLDTHHQAGADAALALILWQSLYPRSIKVIPELLEYQWPMDLKYRCPTCAGERSDIRHPWCDSCQRAMVLKEKGGELWECPTLHCTAEKMPQPGMTPAVCETCNGTGKVEQV